MTRDEALMVAELAPDEVRQGRCPSKRCPHEAFVWRAGTRKVSSTRCPFCGSHLVRTMHYFSGSWEPLEVGWVTSEGRRI